MPERPVYERHTHMTRDIRPRGSDCPVCEAYWARADERKDEGNA